MSGDPENMNIEQIVRFICFALLLSLIPFPALAEDFTNAIHAFLQHRVDVDKVCVGMAVGLVDENGSRVVSYGRLDNGTDQEMNGDTVFAICSVTKTFTGLLLQDIVERGEMKLDDPVAKYLPQSVRMPTRNGKEITLRQLATHSSGLPKWPDDLNPDLADHPCDDYPAEKFYADLSGYKLTREPSAKFEYSSVGMGLLGHVIALRAATNYESLVVDRICRPLKMDSTRITLPPGLKSRNATGHNDLGYAVYQVAGCPGSDQGPGVWTNDPQKAEPITPFNRDWRHEAMVGYGELHSTVNDLLKYLSANLGLTPSNLTSLMEKTHAVHFHQTRDIGVGLAWFITSSLQRTKIISHVGDTLGFSSFVGFDKTRRRGVVILINSYDVADACAAGISLLESEWQSDRPKETALDNKIYESYLGQYHLSPDFALGMLMLRQFLRNAPEVLLYVPAGVCLVVLVVLLRRAAGFRKRCIVLGGAALVTGALGALLALILAHVVCASLHLGIGIRLEGNRMFAQYTLDQRSSSAVISKLLQILNFRAKFNPSLSTEFWPAIPGELLPESESRFFNRLTGMPVTFLRDTQGKATGLIVHIPGAEFSFAKTSDRPPKAPEAPKQYVAIKLDPKLLDAFVGQYEFAPVAAYPTGVRLTIRRQGDQLIGDMRGKNIFGGVFELYPESETNLFDTIYFARYSFRKNDKEEATVGIHYWGPDLAGKKLSAPAH
jgi:CubicO group peptidase (beta-lactamase class C family)